MDVEIQRTPFKTGGKQKSRETKAILTGFSVTLEGFHTVLPSWHAGFCTGVMKFCLIQTIAGCATD